MTHFATRREVLAAGVGLATALAGCRSAGDGGSGSATTTGSPSETPTASETTTGETTTGEPTPDVPATPVGPDAWPAYRWRQDLETGVKDLLADESGDRVYVRTSERTLAYGSDGRRQWASQVTGHLRTMVGDVVVVDSNGLHGLDAATGETRWSAFVSSDERPGFRAFAVLDDHLYTVGRKNSLAGHPVDEEFSRLYRIDPASGDAVELLDLPGNTEDDWAATATGDTLYLARDDGVVIAYDADATERWRVDLWTGEETDAVDEARPTTGERLTMRFGGVRDGTLYVGIEDLLQRVHALDTATGDVLWEIGGFNTINSVTADRLILLGDRGHHEDKRVGAVDPDSGTEQWSRVIKRGRVDSSLGLTTGGVHYAALLFKDDTTELLALDVATGETLATATFEGIGLVPPVPVGDALVFATQGRDGGRLLATAPLDPAG